MSFLAEVSDFVIDTAKAVIKASNGKGIEPIRTAFKEELRLGRDAVRADIKSAARQMAKNGLGENGVLANEAEDVAKALKNNNLDEIIGYADRVAKAEKNNDIYKAAIDKYNDKRILYEPFAKGGLSPEGEEIAAALYFGKEAGDGLGAFRTAQGFMANPTRRNVAIAGYATGVLAARTINGGSLTTNNRGERDIAGIPFI